MDKRSQMLIAVVIVGIFFSITILYRKIMLRHNFDVMTSESGMPEITQ